jgi:tetratricopeptide (TPR) repeat protein
MIKYHNHKRRTYNLIATLTALLLLAITFNISKILVLPGFRPKPQESAFNIDQRIVTISSFGQKRALADIIWVKTLVESDLEHFRGDDYRSWMFLRFWTISFLDPFFFENYVFGGQYLSVVKDDVLGAERLFLRGLEFYPDNFWLNYYAASNRYFELGDIEGSIELFQKILNSEQVTQGRFSFLQSLVARLQTSMGDLSAAYDILSIAYKNEPEGSLKQRYWDDLYSLKAEMDLNCLNSDSNENCSKNDLEGVPYTKNLKGEFRSAREWSPFRIKKRRGKSPPR